MKKIDDKLRDQIKDWKKLKGIIDNARAGIGDIHFNAKEFYFGCKEYYKKYGAFFKYNQEPKEKKEVT